MGVHAHSVCARAYNVCVSRCVRAHACVHMCVSACSCLRVLSHMCFLANYGAETHREQMKLGPLNI